MIKRSGQTLLEVLVASTVIIVGIVSLLTALLSANAAGNSATSDVIAVELARETLEAARFIRDSNVFQQEAGLNQAFYSGFSSSTEARDYSAIYTWDPAQTDPELAVAFDFTADAITHSSTQVYQTPTNDYRQSLNAEVGWTASQYRRFVTFYPICSSDNGITEQVLTGDGQACAVAYPGSVPIGIRVSVQVRWLDRGATRSETLETSLYNWRYAAS